MEFRDIYPDNREEGNPFSARISFESGYESGSVRVTPPFIPGEAYLENLSAEASCVLRHWVTGQWATILDFNVTIASSLEMENKDRVVRTVQTLTNELGGLASIELFE